MNKETERIPEPATLTSRHILLYGHYVMLLESRRLLLEHIGFLVDVAESQDDVRSLVGQAREPYSLIVVCHTLSMAEQLWMKNAADVSAAPVHQLTPLILPKDLLRQAEELMRIKQVHSTVY